MRNLLKKSLPLPLQDRLRQILALLQAVSPKLARNSIGKVDDHWRKRIDTVLSSPDNAHIKRVADAGKLSGFHLTMHNGVKVCAHGYYGKGMLNMLVENKGVHEPQEERIFAEIIDRLPGNSRMLELGAYWAFYSLSLLQRHPRARCYLVEPDPANLMIGKINFRLNRRRGTFVRAMVGAAPQRKPPTISVDTFCEIRQISHLEILHADIQGQELAMLHGADRMLSGKQIDCIFISTHSNRLHGDCIEHFRSKGYDIVAEAGLDGTYSLDGLIVAKVPSFDFSLNPGLSLCSP